MALIPSHFRFLLTQREMFPAGIDGGRVLCLGVQDVHATHEQLEEMMRAAGLSPVEIPANERRFTHSQIVHRDRRCAHIKDVFRMLGYAETDTIDFSDAESPDIIHDLNNPIPEDLKGRYDLVFDIGVVEHVCDIFQALTNCMALVKMGGHVSHLVPLHGWHNMTYFNFQPMYFQEVYTANGFELTQTYINYYPQYDEWKDRPLVYREYCYGDEIVFQMPRKFTNLCFFARKTRSPEILTRPIQGFYLRYHGAADDTPAPTADLDGRRVAQMKGRLPAWLLNPLLALNRSRLQLEDWLLPYALRERLWCWRHNRHLRALDRIRTRKIYRV